MDSIQQTLHSRAPIEPPQLAALKTYVHDKHGVSVQASMTAKYYRILAPSASLAGVLRVETAQIMKECNLDKRLVIHIGH